MIATYVVSLLLIGLSGVLLDMHRRSWREAQQDGSLTERDLRFARSQYKRRMQSSSIIGVLGAAIGVAPLVPHEPMAFAFYLAAISAACMAIMLLAAIDAWATNAAATALPNRCSSARRSSSPEESPRFLL